MRVILTIVNLKLRKALLLEPPQLDLPDPQSSLQPCEWRLEVTQSTEPRLKAFWVSAFLVAVPVFAQAPLVRLFPWTSLLLSGIWLLGGWQLLRSPRLRFWGDLLIGFGWSWLAGSVYWGWFRWEPYVHLPIEAIALPAVALLLLRNRAQIGSFFYLGSLLGTVITDLYFYWVDLIPYWRQVMSVPPAEAGSVLHAALGQMQTLPGVSRAAVLLALLLALGILPMQSKRAIWWSFSGAILSTILVDSLFFAAAVLA